MRDSSTVSQKLKQVLVRHLQRRLKDVLRRRPRTCLHNHSFDLGRPGDEIGMCFYVLEGKPRAVPCDERIKGCGIEQAKRCPFWEPRRGREDVRAEFRSTLESGNLALIAAEFPDAAALMWVLEEGPNYGEIEDAVED